MPADRLTDEQVADFARFDDYGAIALLAREVQAHRALRADCPTCGGSGEQVVTQDGMGETIHAHITCPDCTDGKMPLDKLVAIGVAVLTLDVDEFGVWQLGSDPADEYRERYWPGVEHLIRDLRNVRPK